MLTLPELTKRLLDFPATQFVGLVAVHEPFMRAKSNPFAGKVLEVSRANGAINFKYSRTVNKQRKREDKPADFVACERVWGNPIQGCPLIFHFSDAPHLYLELKRERIERWFYHSETLEPIAESELTPFLKRRGKSRQKLNREIVLRDYRLDHIAEITINGETLQIDPVWWKLRALRGVFREQTTKAKAKG